MKLPKHFLDSTSAAKYREYLKLLPNIKQENTRIITTLILTFFAMSFFGIFAINPTLTTIVNLRKQLEDSRLVYAQLKTKINNLSSLSQQYALLEPELPLVLEALPTEPQPPGLMSLILGLAQEKRITIKSFNILELSLTQFKQDTNTSYDFSLRAVGSYESLMDFTKDLTNISRIVTVESISISKDLDPINLVLNITGKAYYKK